MFHTKLPDILASKEAGKVRVGIHDVYVQHDEYEGTVLMWPQSAGSWPFYRSGLADHDNPDEKQWQFADTVDVYIDEATGYSMPIKGLDKGMYVIKFLNRKGAPLTLQDVKTK